MNFKLKKNIGKIKHLEKKAKIRIKQSIKKHPKLTTTGKYIIKLIGFSFILFSLLIFIYVISNYGNLNEQAKEVIGIYGYMGTFVIAFLVDMLFQPLGPELPLITGLLSGLNPWIIIILVVLGSSIASYFGYFLGRKYGKKGVKRLYRNKVYNKWCNYYNKYGKITLTLAALTPLPYVPFCWFSGILNMKLKNFFLFAILPRSIRILAVGLFILYLI